MIDQKPTLINGKRRYTAAQAARVTGYTRTRIVQLFHAGHLSGLVIEGRVWLDAATIDRLGEGKKHRRIWKKASPSA